MERTHMRKNQKSWHSSPGTKLSANSVVPPFLVQPVPPEDRTSLPRLYTHV